MQKEWLSNLQCNVYYPVDIEMANDETYLKDTQRKRLIALLLKSNIIEDLGIKPNK